VARLLVHPSSPTLTYLCKDIQCSHMPICKTKQSIICPQNLHVLSCHASCKKLHVDMVFHSMPTSCVPIPSIS
jgi:hypothetical protein